MEKDLYDLDLHEQTRFNDGDIITRVPGGWLYTIHRLDSKCMTTSFVSYENGFNESSLSVNSKLLDEIKQLKAQVEILKGIKNES